MRIYKYPLLVASEQTITLPKGYQILDIQFQETKLQLWAMSDETVDTVGLKIYIIGTGEKFSWGQFERYTEFICTRQCQDFVWHIFGMRLDP